MRPGIFDIFPPTPLPEMRTRGVLQLQAQQKKFSKAHPVVGLHSGHANALNFFSEFGSYQTNVKRVPETDL